MGLVPRLDTELGNMQYLQVGNGVKSAVLGEELAEN